MGFLVRIISRRNIFAIVVGALVAGGPMIALNVWLEGLIDRQGEAEVGTAARRAIALAEARVRNTVGALDSLATRGINACEPRHIEAMRYAAFSTIPVKEVAIVGPDAETLCIDLGLPLGERTLLSSELLVGAAGYWLDIIVLSTGERMVACVGKLAQAPMALLRLFRRRCSFRRSPRRVGLSAPMRGSSPGKARSLAKLVAAQEEMTDQILRQTQNPRNSGLTSIL